ncbi:hypothetical protein [Oryzifoliimicrobium ureilyticus]|uniref:hypothetical protein n=1 Tax=Oryzifoliimicrobium ureilyticus TaxID=3113724 RepID=UPI0030761646
MGVIVWFALVGLILALSIVARRLVRQNRDEGLLDVGNAILQFNRAYPNEAVRALQSTRDGEAIFLRLHDDRTGFMRSMQKHYSCHIIEPGHVRVSASDTGQGLRIEFLDAPHQSGTFEFSSPAHASEVSLWLLGNYVAEPDRELPAASAADAQ